jgi:predicted transcriptional regulator
MEYISNDYKALALNTKVSDAKVFFKDLPFTHFPIVENGKLVGMLSQADIIHSTKNDSVLKDLHYLFEFYTARIPIHCIDLFSLFAQYDTDILPIVNDTQEYLGYFELDEILQLFYNTPFLQRNSTTLIIEKDKKNYSMSEIAQIIESNNITLLGIYISGTSNETNQITLRLATEDVNEVIQSLRRYEYHVLSQNKDDLLIEQLKDRSDYLQKYLDF